MLTFEPNQYSSTELVELKGTQTVSLCIPCRDEAATIGQVVRAFRRGLTSEGGLIDEIIVIDDRSTDFTARVAREAGADVVNIKSVHATYGEGYGKGNALWASLSACSGDIVVWCDGDVTSAEPVWVNNLVAPLLTRPELTLVKASFDRPTNNGGGGRTTELVARPLFSMFAPGLAELRQPLVGEMAGRRAALESIGFVEGWGAEVAMLMDLAKLYGFASIAQVHLGERVHRHRDLTSLGLQAAEVAATILDRAGVDLPTEVPVLHRVDGTLNPLNLDERPSLASLR